VTFGDEQTMLSQQLNEMIRPLMLYSLGLTTDDDLKKFYLPQGQAKVFIYAPLTPPFQTLFLPGAVGAERTDVEPLALPAQSGGVLYSYNVAI
jgi:hypothetical protein